MGDKKGVIGCSGLLGAAMFIVLIRLPYAYFKHRNREEARANRPEYVIPQPEPLPSWESYKEKSFNHPPSTHRVVRQEPVQSTPQASTVRQAPVNRVAVSPQPTPSAKPSANRETKPPAKPEAKPQEVKPAAPRRFIDVSYLPQPSAWKTKTGKQASGSVVEIADDLSIVKFAKQRNSMTRDVAVSRFHSSSQQVIRKLLEDAQAFEASLKK